MGLTDLIDPYRPATGPPPGRLWPFVRWCVQGAGWVIAAGVVLSALAGLVETGNAVVLGWAVDAVTARGPEQFWSAENLRVLALAAAFFLVLRPVAFGLSNLATQAIIGPAIAPMVTIRLQRWMLTQSVGFFDDDFAGRLAQKQAQVAHALTEFVVESINTVTFVLASVLGAAVLVASIDLRLAGLFALWLAGYGLLIRWFLPRIRARSQARAGARAQVTGQVVDTITNIRLVKLFSQGAREDRAALGAVEDFRRRSVAFGRLAAGFRFALIALAGLLPLLMTGGAFAAWARGAASNGDVIAAGVVAIRLAQMTGWASFALMNLYRDIGEIEDGMRTLAVDRRLLDWPGARPLEVTAGEVRFEDVSFAYGRAEGGVSGVSLTVAPGEKLGLVGPSGAGKSTLVSLLLRLYEPEAGRILIDGQDIAHVTQDSLRAAIGMVTQETAMFNRSAAENILYGRPEAGLDVLEDAARKAEAHEFIGALRDGAGRAGYAAHLGERGVKLSGGQRQRIALARAIVKDAPILVLDEATSALDSGVEAAIQTALHRVMQGKTVIAIAHRLSTLAEMDRIAVLEAGRIVEIGTHDELLARGGTYAALWAHQSGGFIGGAEAAE